MKSLLTTILIFLFSISGNVMAQSDSYSLLEDSNMLVEGTSTMHDWEAEVQTINSEIEFDESALEEDSQSSPVKSFSLTIPVEDMDSGKRKMNNKMYEALKEGDYPNIEFELTDSELTEADSELSSLSLDVTGDLTIAGSSNEITLPVTGEKQNDGSYKFTGSYELNMEDYDVDPPSAMFGTIKTGEMVTISFEFYVAKS